MLFSEGSQRKGQKKKEEENYFQERQSLNEEERTKRTTYDFIDKFSLFTKVMSMIHITIIYVGCKN